MCSNVCTIEPFKFPSYIKVRDIRNKILQLRRHLQCRACTLKPPHRGLLGSSPTQRNSLPLGLGMGAERSQTCGVDLTYRICLSAVETKHPLCLQQQAWAKNGLLESVSLYVWRLTYPYLQVLRSMASDLIHHQRHQGRYYDLLDFPNLQSRRMVTPNDKWICQMLLRAKEKSISPFVYVTYSL